MEFSASVGVLNARAMLIMFSGGLQVCIRYGGTSEGWPAVATTAKQPATTRIGTDILVDDALMEDQPGSGEKQITTAETDDKSSAASPRCHWKHRIRAR